MENYSRKLGIGADIRRKGKVERVMLQTQDFKVSQEKESYIRISIRELDRIPNTNQSTLYTIDCSLCTHYSILS